MNHKKLLAGLLLATALAAPASAEVVFKWANDGDIRAMDPNTIDETVQNSFLSGIYEPLVRRSRTLGTEPALAMKWENPSPSVWRFHLRPGVKWQDGAPFTADDVLFTYKRTTAKTSATSGNLASVKDVRKIDDLTVEFETKAPEPILDAWLTNVPIMPKQWMEKNNSAEAVTMGAGENFALRNAMGTGAFRLVSREPDRKTVVEKNPAWWDKPVHNIDRAEFTVISSAATRVAALLSGEMDMIYSVPPQDIDRIGKAQGIKLVQGPEVRNIYLGMDQIRDELQFSNVKGKNPFKDVRVRQAFNLAIDEDAIVSRVLRGQGRASAVMWAPGVNGYNKALDVRVKPDLNKAKALLAEAGYPNGFEVTLDCPNDRYIADEQICVAVSAMMARIGVKVNVFARTKVKYFTDIIYPNYNTSFYLLGWTPSTIDAHNVIRDHLVSRDRPGYGVGNVAGYSNKRIDALEPLIAVELDKAKRQAMIDEVATIVRDEVGFIPLHDQFITWAVRDGVSVVQTPDNAFRLFWVTKK